MDARRYQSGYAEGASRARRAGLPGGDPPAIVASADYTQGMRDGWNEAHADGPGSTTKTEVTVATCLAAIQTLEEGRERVEAARRVYDHFARAE